VIKNDQKGKKDCTGYGEKKRNPETWLRFLSVVGGGGLGGLVDLKEEQGTKERANKLEKPPWSYWGLICEGGTKAQEVGQGHGKGPRGWTGC